MNGDGNTGREVHEGGNCVQIVVHIDEEQAAGERMALMRDLMKRSGIQAVSFTPGREHLMLVRYDTDVIHASEVLDYVQKINLHAQLVGGV